MELSLEARLALYARTLLCDNGLAHWTFGFNTNKRRRGVCKYAPRRIEISRHLVALGEAEARNTIAHEVAHAVVGVGHAHNHVWRRKALELGCDGRTCGKSMNVKPKWIGTCPSGHTVERHRCPRRPTSCVKCSTRFDARYLFSFHHNT